MQGRPKGSGKLAAQMEFLTGRVKAQPDITMPELAAELLAARGVKANPAEGTLQRRLHTQKQQLMASERERADVRERRVWIDERRPLMRLQPRRLVFIDETAVTKKMTRLRGRSLCGDRLQAAPFGRWDMQTFIAALRRHGLKAPWVIHGAMDRIAFDLWVETQLAPPFNPETS